MSVENGNGWSAETVQILEGIRDFTAGLRGGFGQADSKIQTRTEGQTEAEGQTGAEGQTEAEGQTRTEIETEPPVQCDIMKFVLLLSGISTYRKAPGIKGFMGFDQLYHCETEEDSIQTAAHLERMYEVTDAASLKEVCQRMFHSGGEYAQFLSFWKGQPVFDEKDLDDYGKEAFHSCKAYAEQFREFTGDKGFYAWDANEQVGLCRKAAACGIITEEEFYQMCVPIAKRMSAIYDSWEEYAVSSLCGAVYFMFCESGRDDEGLLGFFEINRKILEMLLSEEGEWRVNGWFRPQKKEYAMTSSEIKELLVDWEEAEGCLATDRIVVDGCKVGYMYREEPDGGVPDSGWRFFAGDESEEYTNTAENVGIYHLNTLCNYDPDILPLLHAPYGTAYFRDENGTFRREKLAPRME